MSTTPTMKALSIQLGSLQELPFELEPSIPGKSSPFYIIPAKLPHGLLLAPGFLLVCEAYLGGAVIKAWKFNILNSWNPVDRVDEDHKRYISIDTLKGQVWTPGDKTFGVGVTTVTSSSSAGTSVVVDRVFESFQNFMDRNFPYPV